jgi:Ner family transcriptional regulator
MHFEDVKANLRKRGSSLSQIAKDLGLKRATVSTVIRGGRSKRVEQAIADALGKPVEEVFPDRYFTNRAG